MTALIEAVRRVLERAERPSRHQHHTPISGHTAMQWLLEELTAPKDWDEFVRLRKQEEINATIDRCAEHLAQKGYTEAAAEIAKLKEIKDQE